MAPADSSRNPTRRARDETCDAGMTVTLKGSRGGEDEGETVAALGQLHAQRRGERAVEPDADAEVVLQPVEVEVRRACRDLPCVVEERGFEIAVGHDPPFRLQQEAVLIAEAPARITTERGS